MNREETGKIANQVIAKAWADADFKEKLLANPKETLRGEGLEIPGVEAKVVENTDNVFYFVIPVKPTELSDEDLEQVAGGKCCSSIACCCC